MMPGKGQAKGWGGPTAAEEVEQAWEEGAEGDEEKAFAPVFAAGGWLAGAKGKGKGKAWFSPY